MTGDSAAPTDSGGSPRPLGFAADCLEGRAFLLLALILIVAAAVRLIDIGRQSFSVDEIAELRIARAGIADVVTFGDGFPPLYHLILRFLLPFGDFAGRVLSALCGVATVGVTWALARRVAGMRVGLHAASLVALSPLAVQLSQEGRAYALMALLAAASLWSLWVVLDDPSTLRWARWGLVSALGIYTHYLFVVVIAAGLIAALIEVRGRPSREMWIGIGTLGMLATPVLALLPADIEVQMNPGFARGFRPAQVVLAGYRFVVGLSLGPSTQDLQTGGIQYAIKSTWTWIATLTPLLGVLLVQGHRALDRVAWRRLLTLSVSGFLLQSVAIKASRAGFGVRYFLWLVVPVAVWLAAGLAHLRARWRWATMAILLVVAVFSVVVRNLDPHHEVGDARGVAAYLESSGALDHPVLVTDMARPIVYYINRPLALALPDHWDPETGRLGYYPDEQLGLIGMPPLENAGFGLADALGLADAYTQPGEPYYLVYGAPFYSDPHGELLAALQARDGLALVKSFAGMDLYRGVRAG